MKTYKMNGGWKIEAENNIDLVNKLNQQSLFGYKENIEQFMLGVVRACELYNSSQIRFDSVDNFIEDLILNDFLVEVQND